MIVMASKICSFNCRGLKGSTVDLSILARSFDLICLQETWLMQNELSILNNIVPGMTGVGVSAVNVTDGILRGRPFGGVAILWQKSLKYTVALLKSGLDWLIAVTLADDNGVALTIVNVYLPCDGYANVDKYMDYLGKIQAFISDLDGPYILIGDFNCNPNDSNSPCGKILREFVKDVDLTMIDDSLPTDSYTFTSDVWQSSSWIDHCFGPRCLGNFMVNCWIVYDIFHSDHYPIALSLNLPCGISSTANVATGSQSLHARLPRIDFSKVTPDVLGKFQSCIFNNLDSIGLSHLEAICCSNTNCSNNDHIAEIDVFYSDLISCLADAVKLCFSETSNHANFKKSVPGWNDHVSDSRAAASDAYRLWQQWNKPRKGPLFELMKRSRARYKYAVRLCRRFEGQTVADNLAKNLSAKKYSSFWRMTSKVVSPNSTVTNKVGDAAGSTDICKFWKNHYESLFNGVSYNDDEMNSIFKDSFLDVGNITYVTHNEVLTAINTMANNKASDCYGLCIEHFKLAGDLYCCAIATCINSMMIHGYIPSEATQTVICPTVKEKNGDISDASNYRPIALATIFSKIVEHILLCRLQGYLSTSDNQFGFKRGHSTLMPILLLKELLRFYSNHGTNMFVCFLDASKAFDRIAYSILFSKLFQRNVPNYIIRLLWSWYGNHYARILWAGIFSETFRVCNGVRQGGILSPFLFAIYIDELSLSLQSVQVGCYLSQIIINHFLFADDAVIFAPSAKGLQQLLDVCSTFAETHKVVFNVVKSQCLIVRSNCVMLHQPVFKLSGSVLPFTDCYKYLGHLINSSLSDDADILKQTRSTYARSNTILRKFSICSLHTKLMLFRAYCTSLYGCQLWCSSFQYSVNKLRVAYNDAFRHFLNEPRWCSASTLFVIHNIPTFDALIRKLIFSLWSSFSKCDNDIIRNLMCSDLHTHSKLFSRWRSLLF